MALNESFGKQISELVAKSRVVLFMKGTRHAPQCGFSATVVQILDGLVPSYETVDVLSSPELRDGIKEFSKWPTIPQLYVDGQFVGGCDIVREMHASGELQKLIGVELSEPKTPAITMTDAAIKAFEAAVTDAGDAPHLQIDAEYRHELFLGPPAPGDIEVRTNALPLLLDRSSARRADGVKIDFVVGGFKIDNPNEPPRVKSLTPKELKAMFDRDEKIELFDVRTPEERAIAKLDRARHLNGEGEKLLLALDRNAPVAFHCHHGVRSRAAAERALKEGFKNVYNLEGGIDAWSQTVDPAIARY